jgi:hypothetical protein
MGQWNIDDPNWVQHSPVFHGFLLRFQPISSKLEAFRPIYEAVAGMTYVRACCTLP